MKIRQEIKKIAANVLDYLEERAKNIAEWNEYERNLYKGTPEEVARKLRIYDSVIEATRPRRETWRPY